MLALRDQPFDPRHPRSGPRGRSLDPQGDAEVIRIAQARRTGRGIELPPILLHEGEKGDFDVAGGRLLPGESMPELLLRILHQERWVEGDLLVWFHEEPP